MARATAWSRYELGMRSFAEAGLLARGLAEYRQEPASDDELSTAHDPAYLARLHELDEARHVFNPGGGLHHAHAAQASGFCLLNDVAVAARHLEERFGLRRIAVLDVDAHHGDGTQALLSQRALVVSLHEYGARLFPGTGAADDRGGGLALNLSLARDDGDRAVLDRLRRAEAAIRTFVPELLVVQFGTDAHAADPFAHLRVSDAGFAEIPRRTHALAHEVCDGRLVVLGGGGYEPVTFARLWTHLLGELLH